MKRIAKATYSYKGHTICKSGNRNWPWKVMMGTDILTTVGSKEEGCRFIDSLLYVKDGEYRGYTILPIFDSGSKLSYEVYTEAGDCIFRGSSEDICRKHIDEL